MDAHDLSSVCDKHVVARRAGDNCTQPLHDSLGMPASAPASYFCYHTREKVNRLVEPLKFLTSCSQAMN